MSSRALSRPGALLILLFPSLITGCKGRVLSAAEARSQQRAAYAAERQQLDQIPPPSKNRYMAVHSTDTWENPYITIQPDMLTVHILFADQNPSSFGSGGMLRPTGARRQEVNISFDKLAEAMGAIPPTSWPYGRVVAVEEAHQTPGKQEPTIRRNMEVAVGTLNDLGIVAYDLKEGSLR